MNKMKRLLMFVCLAIAMQNLSARESRLLGEWCFHVGDFTNATSPALLSATWQTVAIPHCWGWQAGDERKPWAGRELLKFHGKVLSDG